MNYRHGFHAGNFADVHKHAVLARIIMRLREKPTAFRILDTHAGAGLYDLAADEAARTGEWQNGIARLDAGAPLSAEAAALLAPYREAVAAARARHGASAYPGSPLIAAALMRPQDRLIACELEPSAAAALTETLARDRRAKAIAIDGWTALTAYIPPKERRGLVLIDPPFERPDEFARLPERLAAAHRKWPTGIFLLWYPIKSREAADRLGGACAEAGLGRLIRSELTIGAPSPAEKLAGSGLLIVNPPWRLAEDLAVLVPAFAQRLRRDAPAAAQLDWLAGGD